jgi:hypothetical protein
LVLDDHQCVRGDPRWADAGGLDFVGAMRGEDDAPRVSHDRWSPELGAPVAERRVGVVSGPSALATGQVAPVVTYLCHESCPVSGEVLRASGGHVARVFVGITDGHRNPELTAEDVRAQLDVILDTSAFSIPGSATVGLQVRS